MDKALVLFSGGLDSTVALGAAVRDYAKQNVIALTVYYGQKHDNEIAAAKKVAEFYGVEHIILDLFEIFRSSTSTLLKGNGEIEKGEYASQPKNNGVIDTYVPFRNGLMISAAATVALSKACNIVVYGAHKDDATAAYPDCTVEFFETMAAALKLGSGEILSLKAPFIDMKKKDIVAGGFELNVPFGLTWSCYRGGEKPCGECATCIDRQKAFSQNNASDPLLG